MTNVSVRHLTDPAIEPVTLAEAKLWCRIDDDDTSQDSIVLLLIGAARERAEQITERAFARATFEQRLDVFPDDLEPIWIKRSPLVSVQSITYVSGGSDVIMAGSPAEFVVDLGGDESPGRVAPLSGATWPVADASIGGIRIAFTAGYATASKMPKLVRLWIQARISTWYEFREHLAVGIVNELPRDHVDGLLDDLRARSFFA